MVTFPGPEPELGHLEGKEGTPAIFKSGWGGVWVVGLTLISGKLVVKDWSGE